MTLTDKQWQTIEHALRVAADRFVADAQVCIEEGHPRLADQFTLQERESRELADLIANR